MYRHEMQDFEILITEDVLKKEIKQNEDYQTSQLRFVTQMKHLFSYL